MAPSLLGDSDKTADDQVRSALREGVYVLGFGFMSPLSILSIMVNISGFSTITFLVLAFYTYKECTTQSAAVYLALCAISFTFGHNRLCVEIRVNSTLAKLKASNQILASTDVAKYSDNILDMIFPTSFTGSQDTSEESHESIEHEHEHNE